VQTKHAFWQLPQMNQRSESTGTQISTAAPGYDSIGLALSCFAGPKARKLAAPWPSLFPA
jgi:hypothetical protein